MTPSTHTIMAAIHNGKSFTAIARDHGCTPVEVARIMGALADQEYARFVR